MMVFIYILVLLSIGFIWWGLFSPTLAKEARPRLPEVQSEVKRIRMQAFASLLFPFTQKIIERVGLYAKIKAKIDFVHLKISPAVFFNLKIIFMFLLCGLAFIFMGRHEGWVYFLCLLFGYVVPDIWLNRLISKRKYIIFRLLPETIDLLGLCVEAGLDFVSAVKWLIAKIPNNPLVEELVFVLEEIRWGKPRSQALKDMAKRINILEMTSFVQSLVLAERMGTPVAEAFTIISEDTRMQRFHRGERIAMQAPIKILLPLIFCILPVIFIIVAGPILLQFGQVGILNTIGK